MLRPPAEPRACRPAGIAEAVDQQVDATWQAAMRQVHRRSHMATFCLLPSLASEASSEGRMVSTMSAVSASRSK